MKKEQSIQSVLHKLNAEPMKVKLSMIQDADALYSKIVQGAKSQVSILLKVEQELKSLEALAKQLQKMERKLESIVVESILTESAGFPDRFRFCASVCYHHLDGFYATVIRHGL